MDDRAGSAGQPGEMTKLLLLKAVIDRQCRAFSASAAEHIKYLEAAAEKAATQNGIKSINVILHSSNVRGGGCRECRCTRCTELFAEELSSLEVKTRAIDEPDLEPQSESSRPQRPRRAHQDYDVTVEHPAGDGCTQCDERRAFNAGLTWRKRMQRFTPDNAQLLSE
jgi:hypothetical protein